MNRDTAEEIERLQEGENKRETKRDTVGEIQRMQKRERERDRDTAGDR